MGNRKCDDADDGSNHGQRQNDRKRPAVVRTEIIQHTEEEDDGNGRRKDPCRRHAEITQPRPGTQGRGHGEVGDEQQRADHREQTSVRTGRGIHAAAAGKTAADNHVVEPDDEGQGADGEDDWQGGKAHRGEGQTDDVGFARAPVAVEQAGCAAPAEIAGTVDFHIAEEIGSSGHAAGGTSENPRCGLESNHQEFDLSVPAPEINPASPPLANG